LAGDDNNEIMSTTSTLIPVKHGYVSKVRDWPHSSFHRFVAKGILPPDWGGDAGEVTGAFGE
jgi:putative transposase